MAIATVPVQIRGLRFAALRPLLAPEPKRATGYNRKASDWLEQRILEASKPGARIAKKDLLDLAAHVESVIRIILLIDGERITDRTLNMRLQAAGISNDLAFFAMADVARRGRQAESYKIALEDVVETLSRPRRGTEPISIDFEALALQQMDR